MKIEDNIAHKASIDGHFAIAYALLKLAEAQAEVALALDMLGANRAGRANYAMGTTEFIGKQLEEIANAISTLGRE